MNIVGFLDDNVSRIGQEIFKIPVLGPISSLSDYEIEGIVIAVGDNAIRYRIAESLQLDESISWLTVTHPEAVISKYATIESGTVVMGGVVINPDTKIGKHSIVNTGAKIDHDCVIGDFAHVAPGTTLAGNVTVEDKAFLGAGCSVIPGCTIGEGAIIGAAAAIISDIPPFVVAKGIPAKW
jgi:acetyltransferase EpsM